ncbi:MAG: cysteine hydrolase family protein [Pseudomonadota bacterium]
MNLAETALLVVDVQMAFVLRDAKGAARTTRGAEEAIAHLIKAFREAGGQVIHIHHDSTDPDSAFKLGAEGGEVQPCAAPAPGEAIYVKHVNSGFIGTTLEADLRRDGISHLVICGATANHCVETTTRMAGNLGFDAYLVADAVWAYDATGPDGRSHAPEDVLSLTLSNLHEEFATVVSSGQVMGRLGLG